MKASDPIPTALAVIASLFRRENYQKHALDIEKLREAGLSPDAGQQQQFHSAITQNNWYWLGMGTIADISFRDRELNREFVHAYFDLASACESAGLGSIYSRNVRDVFGGWIRRGAV